MQIEEIKDQICDVCHKMWQLGWVAANDGNVSVRLEDGTFLATPTGMSKSFITPDKLLRIDAKGNVLEGAEGLRPSSEIKMHLRCYEKRADVNAVVHAHPPAATGFAVAHRPMDMYNMIEDVAAIGAVHETIPHFHDTPKRFADFQRAVAEDRMGRAALVQREIEFVRAREAEYHVMVDLLAAGKLPLRVTHNDTKLNNILFDKTTGEGLCVIDLDTVMPGLAANDFGDSIRFGANHCAEDEADLSKVNFSMELYEIYTKGFLQAAGEAFTPLEKQTLPWGAKLMTMECGMRFLADYLEGDHYFHINYETQNLNRARTQFKLTADMERNWDAMQKVIEKYK